MSLAVKYNAQKAFVESTLSGIVSPAELSQEMVQVAAMSQEHACELFLSDFQDAEIGFSILDVFDLPDLQDEAGLKKQTARIALLAPRSKPGAELARDYEIACMSRGWAVCVFVDRRKALEWLLHT